MEVWDPHISLLLPTNLTGVTTESGGYGLEGIGTTVLPSHQLALTQHQHTPALELSTVEHDHKEKKKMPSRKLQSSNGLREGRGQGRLLGSAARGLRSQMIRAEIASRAGNREGPERRRERHTTGELTPCYERGKT